MFCTTLLLIKERTQFKLAFAILICFTYVLYFKQFSSSNELKLKTLKTTRYVILLLLYIYFITQSCFYMLAFLQMLKSIHIGFKNFGKKTNSIIVDQTIKSRQINFTTVIYVVNVELLDAGECTKDWYIRFLVPVSAAFHQLFDDFLENFICTVLITDSVLSSIGADEVMAFQNSIEQVDFVHQQQTMLNNLKENMITKSIIVIEHDDLFIGNAIFINKPNLAIFRYQTENDILHHDIKREVPGVY